MVNLKKHTSTHTNIHPRTQTRAIKMCYVAICCIDMCTILLYLVSTCAAFCYILYRLFWNGVEFVGYMENKQTNQELDEEQARSVFVRIIKHLSTCLLIYFDGPDISQKAKLVSPHSATTPCARFHALREAKRSARSWKSHKGPY